jgi:AraC family transcriptional regulator of adaptative response/methylated-DNA-[protein]-cysteine methyltransferase
MSKRAEKEWSDERRWRAIAGRDRAADGAFLYGVTTTSVYCRPSCASRRPRRENVRFFADAEAAERAGFRACKRCRPRQRCRVPEAIVRACRAIEMADQPLALADLARQSRLSPFHFQRIFKETLGVTPKAYAAAHRARRFRDGLLEANTVTEAMLDAGFGASSRCYATLDDQLGMTPTQYRRGGAGLEIRFAIVPCHLGWMLVAATERGLCRIEFGDAAEPLQAGLRERFSKADFIAGDVTFADWIKEMLALVEVPSRHCELPIDIQSTAFQRQVWQALRAIPAGSTATYSEIAARIGRPTATRAVAQACASNPVAVLIPCHRVIGAEGGLRGYRWGLERKQELLDREGPANSIAGNPVKSALLVPTLRVGTSVPMLRVESCPRRGIHGRGLE